MKKHDPAEQSVDFRGGVRGRYYESALASRNLVMLDPDLLDTFPDSDSVNAALRQLKVIAERTQRGQAA